MDRTTRRRIFDVTFAVLVGLTAAAVAGWLLRHAGPPLLALNVTVLVALVAALALRGYGHLQLAVSTGTNLTVEWLLVQALLP
ncbi:hypothetical protein B7486_59130 [cyanobacterium TDX16]|nr:hypothetical protein B7486_59130 [cyanobacterium TDX16]